MRPLASLILIGALANPLLGSPERVNEILDTIEGSTPVQARQAQELLAFEDPSVTLDDIEAVAKSRMLTADLLERLDQASLVRFARDEPKGGLGVSFGATRKGHVEIGTVVGTEQFPASKLLKPGDAIIQIDGKVALGSAHLRAEILSRKPGDLIPVLIRRDMSVVERLLPLGAFKNLTGAAQIEEPVIRMAIALRRERLGIQFPTHDSIGAQVGADDWIAAAFERGPSAHTKPINDGLQPGVLNAGSDKLVFSGFPDYPRRGAAWSSQHIAEQNILETKRTEINAKITDGFLRRSQLVLRINSINELREADPDSDSLKANLKLIIRMKMDVEREITKLTEDLDKLAKPETGPID